MDLIIVLVVLLILFLLLSSKEHMQLSNVHFPHAYYDEYIDDLEPASVRLLKPRDIRRRRPCHVVDMNDHFFTQGKEAPKIIMNRLYN